MNPLEVSSNNVPSSNRIIQNFKNMSTVGKITTIAVAAIFTFGAVAGLVWGGALIAALLHIHLQASTLTLALRIAIGVFGAIGLGVPAYKLLKNPENRPEWAKTPSFVKSAWEATKSAAGHTKTFIVDSAERFEAWRHSRA